VGHLSGTVGTKRRAGGVLRASFAITKKWTGKRRERRQIHSQLEIFFADRLPQ